MMAMFANGEEYKEIGYSNFASQNNNPSLMAAVKANNTPRVSDSLVGAPLATAAIQPTAGHVGFTNGYNNATGLGKVVVIGTSLAAGMAIQGGAGVKIAAVLTTFAVGTYAYKLARGN